MKLFIILFSILMAGELEVDGDLKVTGTVDAQGNPITNVGAPQTLTDAVNAGILANALSDDGASEIKSILLRLNANDMYADNTQGHANGKFRQLQEAGWNEGDFDSYLNSYLSSGWNLYAISNLEHSPWHLIIYTLKRSIEE